MAVPKESAAGFIQNFHYWDELAYSVATGRENYLFAKEELARLGRERGLGEEAIDALMYEFSEQVLEAQEIYWLEEVGPLREGIRIRPNVTSINKNRQDRVIKEAIRESYSRNRQ
jgi:hypothetical protein